MAQSPDPLQALKQATDGLLYPSESDQPFDVFCWNTEAGSSETAEQQVASHADKNKKINEISLDEFFEELKEVEDAGRFNRLRQALQTVLRDGRVFRLGSVRIDVYLIGQTPSGDWAGVHTVSVET
jgi:hypothetical protein